MTLYADDGRAISKNWFHLTAEEFSMSEVEILAGTQRANSGPHPQVIHADEVELMDPEIWREAQQREVG